MQQNHPAFTPEAAADEPASLVPFDPVPVRARRDGWTPEKQREFVEALADTGLVREAAARVGMTEQSASRLRRRADARAFDLACDAALRPGARRLHAIAWERAIEGSVKRHYYHGELKAEERVYDNRLLTCLLGKTHALVDPSPLSQSLLDHWERLMEVIEQGLPFDRERSLVRAFDQKIWQSQGAWWTRFPPPAGYDGIQHGTIGDQHYRRTLTEAEEATISNREDEEEARAARDRYFGFEGGTFSSPGEPNL
jgi:hypothetical protein